MITKGYLILSDTDEETGVYAVPIEHFPILPIGSAVQLQLGAYEFEDLSIEYYTANSTWGTLVFTRPVDFTNPAPGAPGRTIMLELFKSHSDSQFDYVYPERISFG